MDDKDDKIHDLENEVASLRALLEMTFGAVEQLSTCPRIPSKCESCGETAGDWQMLVGAAIKREFDGRPEVEVSREELVRRFGEMLARRGR